MKLRAKATRTAALFCLTSAVISCQGVSPQTRPPELSNPVPESGMKKIPAPTPEERAKLIEEAFVSCKTAEACHPAVGMLAVKREDSIGLCTGFLISPTTLVTNSHCMPRNLKSGDKCEDSVEILFPKTDQFPESRARCSELITISNHEDPKYLLSMDFAVLKLASTIDRTSLTVSTNGINVDDALRVVSMTPVSDTKPTGVIEAKLCKAVDKNYFASTFDNPFAPIVSFKDCATVHGNSGSPVLDTNGHVRAIAQANLDKAGLSREFGNSLLDRPADLGFATNLACVPLQANATRQLPSQCSIMPTNQTAKDLLINSPKISETELEKSLRETIEDFVNKATDEKKHFGWTYLLMTDGNKKIMTPMPKCMQNLDNWFAQTFTRHWLWGYPTTTTEAYALPAWNIRIGYNMYMQPDLRIENELSNVLVNVTYNPARLREKLTTESTTEVFTVKFGQQVKLSLATRMLQICQ